MSDEKGFKLFREKSLEAVESPENLNDYLKVTSPGVWLVLTAVIVILIGTLFWSIFGRIETTVQVAVVSESWGPVCLVPYDDLEKALACSSVTVNGETYGLLPDIDAQAEVINSDVNAYIRAAGDLNEGDIVVEVPLDGNLEEGVYTGYAVTESLQPISLLLQ